MRTAWRSAFRDVGAYAALSTESFKRGQDEIVLGIDLYNGSINEVDLHTHGRHEVFGFPLGAAERYVSVGIDVSADAGNHAAQELVDLTGLRRCSGTAAQTCRFGRWVEPRETSTR